MKLIIDRYWGVPDNKVMLKCAKCSAMTAHLFSLESTDVKDSGGRMISGNVFAYKCTTCSSSFPAKCLQTKPLVCGSCGTDVKPEYFGDKVLKRLSCRCTEVYQTLSAICGDCGNPVTRDPVLFRKTCCDE